MSALPGSSPADSLLTGRACTNWDVVGLMVFAATVMLLIASVSGKLLGIHLAGKIPNWSKGEASIIGWLLQTMAMIVIISVNILLDKHIITNRTFAAMLLMDVASTMLTVSLVALKLKQKNPTALAVG